MSRVGSFVIAALAAGCVALGAALFIGHDSTPNAFSGPQDQDATVYRTVATVLQRPGADGPRLCFAVMESLPPQCDGPAIIGWSWSALAPGVAQTAGGVRWGEFVVTGTFTNGVFTLSQRPRTPSAADRAVVDRHASKPANRTADPARAAVIERRLMARPGPLLDGTGRPRPDPGLVTWAVDERSGQPALTVILDRAGALQRTLDTRYGAGAVRVSSLLIPVAAWR